MKIRKITFLTLAAGMVLLSGCGGSKEDEGIQLSEKGKMITGVTWKPDLNATIKEGTDATDSATTIKADIELQGDVKSIADFAAGTLKFAKDESDPTKLSYKRTYGSGFLSTSILGYWNFNADETGIVMREWDSAKGAEKEAKNFEIVELTADRLVLKEEGAASADIYVPNKSE